jgi:Uma2 family endonuclease
MATVFEPQRHVHADQRFVIRGVDWHTYDAILQALGDHRTRVTFDGRDLELMSPSPAHELYKIRFDHLLVALALDLNIEILGGGSTTFRREDLERGLEPDQCYWIQNEPSIRGKQDIDLSVDPPPDLAIEIDISRSALDRMSIYAGLEVPEVWTFDGGSLRIHLLQAGGKYVASQTSRCFPWLPVLEMVPFLQPDEKSGDVARIRRFVAQVRRHFRRDDGQ